MTVDKGWSAKILKYLWQVNVKYLDTRIQPNIDRAPLDPPNTLANWASDEYFAMRYTQI